MNSDINLLIYSEDANFSSALALESNKYGFELTFFEVKSMQNYVENSYSLISIVIVDLDSSGENNCLKLGEDIKRISKFPLFGVVNRITKNIQHKSKDYGFDLILTKRMLLKSLKKVVIHILEQ